MFIDLNIGVECETLLSCNINCLNEVKFHKLRFVVKKGRNKMIGFISELTSGQWSPNEWPFLTL
jgi:hypothetical protein